MVHITAFFSFLAIENPHLEDQRGDKNIILVIQLHFNGVVDSRGFASGFDFNVGVRDGGSEKRGAINYAIVKHKRG